MGARLEIEPDPRRDPASPEAQEEGRAVKIKPVKAWALVKDGKLHSIVMQSLSPWGYGMEAIRVEIRPLPKRRKKVKK